ncbi:MAG: hypothetical protein Q8K93_21170 [Reyranella sp.]|uniref:hypothetical protein n=1 Tax=Reyranella sp. TaxID=1929291 RepID=UPI0027300181|nr:hypothetical protein [Reyranella sp.]MDP1964701.1 hypothetical protein [Reyranella sp.]MDP2374890.1 hypothetical protein [Reyranella sp.]
MTGRYRYVVYGVVVESDFPMRAIDEAPDPAVAATVRFDLGQPEYFRERTRGVAADLDDWLHHTVLPAGGIYMRVDKIFEAIVSPDGRHVVSARLADADDRSFEANLLNFVLSTALTLQGEEPLHATVVDLDGRAVGLLGQSGAGKSTLAAFLIAEGAKLITDDMLRLTFADGFAYAHTGPQRLKLLDETAERLLPEAVGDGYWNTLSGKIMVRPHAPTPERHVPRPLAALFWLGEPAPSSASDVVTTRRLKGIDLARVLTSSAMNIRYFAPDRLIRQLQFAERVAHVLPVHALSYARDYPLLGRIAAEIRRLAGP